MAAPGFTGNSEAIKSIAAILDNCSKIRRTIFKLVYQEEKGRWQHNILQLFIGGCFHLGVVTCLFLTRYVSSCESWARGYKEKHKLDSKLISDSAFRTHLSFCKNREIINLSDLKLKTQTSNSGSWRCYAGGGKRNENRDSI